ncbi:site-specific integrase [Pelagibacterium nitratireducens]|uniref:Site-specific integrase n=1 Tax=Pelagibacterium nitratireducens TaxID=1046114 RepID=A0ABZ2I448_9HYPH
MTNLVTLDGPPPGDPDPVPDWQTVLERLRGAYADTTISGYGKDFRLFAAWCAQKDLCALPADPQTLERYLNEMIQTLSAATLVRRVAAIVRVHRALDLSNPAATEAVRLAMRRIKRHRPNRPRQAHGIDRALRAKLLKSCADDLAGKRDKALLALGFEGLCRRSEIAALDVKDLVTDRQGDLAILIRRGKTDQTGDGRVITLSAATAKIVCDWIEAAGLEAGPLIRPVYRGRPIARHMVGHSISRLLKEIAERADLPPETYQAISGHSLRVGAAQTLFVDGHDVLKLMKMGGWKSANTVFRYIERTEISLWM